MGMAVKQEDIYILQVTRELLRRSRQVRLGLLSGPWYRSVKTCFQRTNKYSAILMTYISMCTTSREVACGAITAGCAIARADGCHSMKAFMLLSC